MLTNETSSFTLDHIIDTLCSMVLVRLDQSL